MPIGSLAFPTAQPAVCCPRDPATPQFSSVSHPTQYDAAVVVALGYDRCPASGNSHTPARQNRGGGRTHRPSQTEEAPPSVDLPLLAHRRPPGYCGEKTPPMNATLVRHRTLRQSTSVGSAYDLRTSLGGHRGASPKTGPPLLPGSRAPSSSSVPLYATTRNKEMNHERWSITS